MKILKSQAARAREPERDRLIAAWEAAQEAQDWEAATHWLAALVVWDEGGVE